MFTLKFPACIDKLIVDILVSNMDTENNVTHFKGIDLTFKCKMQNGEMVMLIMSTFV